MTDYARETVDHLLQAFLKLKSDVFYDTTKTILRHKVVEYEGNRFQSQTNEEFLAKIRLLATTLTDPDDDGWRKKKSSLLDSVGFLPFPKSLSPRTGSANGEKRDGVITNRSPEKPCVIRAQCFIDMDVEGFLLGMLWVLLVGIGFDKKFGDCSYGNRIRKTVREQRASAFDWKPYVFDPYFSQYESWRDGALDVAQHIIRAEKKDVVILTLDIRSFYYCVNMQEEDWDEVWRETKVYVEKGEATRVARRLHDFVREVVIRYSEGLAGTNDVANGHEYRTNVLPIGFHPSAILANWCLSKFDDAVNERLNPAFYGRYVDDIIIVDKVEKGTTLHKSYQSKGITASLLIEQMMFSDNRDLLETVEGAAETYRLKSHHLNARNSRLDVQTRKVKAFYFDHHAPDALIEKFRDTIAKNSSAFRLMPLVDERDLRGSFSVIYNLKNDGSPNKFRDVDDMAVDPYELSKLLGKLKRISPIVTDGLPKGCGAALVNLLDERGLIQFYATWEKLFLILFSIDEQDGESGHTIALLERIIGAVEGVEYRPKSESQPDVLDAFMTGGGDAAHAIKASLARHAISSLSRVLSLSNSRCSARIEANAFELFNNRRDGLLPLPERWHYGKSYFSKHRNLYQSTFMIDKYVCAVPPLATIPYLLDTTDSDEKWSGSLFSLRDTYSLLARQDQASVQDGIPAYYGDSNNKESPLLPYVVREEDLVRSVYHRNIALGKELPSQSAVVELAREWRKVVTHIAESKGGPDVMVTQPKCWKAKRSPTQFLFDIRHANDLPADKVRVAIANVSMDDNDCKLALEGCPNLSYDRYRRLCEALEAAASTNADMILLPELMVPMEWMETVSSFAMREQMAVVCGVEYVVVAPVDGRRNAYNLTAVMLPYTKEKYPYVSITYHSKVRWAPIELDLTGAYGIAPIVGDSYEIYRWHDVWFPVYCCFELASIVERSLFSALADIVIAVEWNRDVPYYANIIESLARDLGCFCVQVNDAHYGDSRIVRPTKSVHRDLVRVKGGTNHAVLACDLDIQLIRRYQLGGQIEPYKPLPPGFNREAVRKKQLQTLSLELVDGG